MYLSKSRVVKAKDRIFRERKLKKKLKIGRLEKKNYTNQRGMYRGIKKR